MKISLKDKRIFIVLGFLGVAVIYYNYFYLNQQKEIKRYTKSILAYEQSNFDNKGLASAVAGIDTEIKILNEKIKNIRSIFPPEIAQKDVLILLKKFSEEAGFSINTIAFSEVKEVSGSIASEATTDTTFKADSETEVKKGVEAEANPSDITAVDREIARAANNEAVGAKDNIVLKDERFLKALDMFGIDYDQTINLGNVKNEVADGKGFALGVNINGTSSNKQLKDFLYKLRSFKSMISINTIQIDRGSDGLLSVRMDINFYGIADRRAAQQGYYFDVQWTPLNPAGKNNIFEPYEGYLGTNNTVGADIDKTNNDSEKIKQQAAYDFSMRVLSYGNNLTPPTVSLLGKSIAADRSSMPIVYGDNKKIENVDLYLENRDEKFYCKFKTEHEAFPESTYLNLAQFEPKGDAITMLIDSSKRVSLDDNAGVSIKVTNKTGKSMVIDVVNDDINRPRVAITKSENNVIVNYK